MAALVVETPASAYPVTLNEVKNFLRVSITDDDAMIMGFIDAATTAVEVFTRRSLCTKGFRQSMDAFPYYTDTVMSQSAYPPSYYALPMYSTTLWNYSQMIKLFRPPLISVDRISYLAASDNQWHDLTPIPKLWYPGTAYTLNTVVMDNDGNQQKCTVAGTSQSDPPTWATNLGGITVENTDSPDETNGPTWQNIGPAFITGGSEEVTNSTQAQFGTYMVDTDSEPARIFPGPPGNFWPQVLYVPNAVQIHFTAGFAANGTQIGDGPGLMPAVFKTAIMMCVANWYENREAAMLGGFAELPNHIKMLLWSKRVLDFQPTRG